VNSGTYSRTFAPDLDPAPGPEGAAPLLPFAPGELDRSAIRMRQADFARLMGVSKQTVSQWVKAGKVRLDLEGFLEPRAAVRQLLKSSDPARLRSRVLAPILAELRDAQAREAALLAQVTELRAQLAEARDEAGFHEAAADDMLRVLALLRARVLANLDALAALPYEERDAALGLLDPLADDPLPADSDGRESLSPREVLEGDGG